MDLSEIFRALGDETRLRILNLLSKKELCVCQINDVLRLSQPNASKHLNRLRICGLISYRKISQWCFYSINQEFMKQNSILYDYLLCQWSRYKVFNDDIKKLDYLLGANDCCKKLLEND